MIIIIFFGIKLTLYQNINLIELKYNIISSHSFIEIQLLIIDEFIS